MSTRFISDNSFSEDEQPPLVERLSEELLSENPTKEDQYKFRKEAFKPWNKEERRYLVKTKGITERQENFKHIF